MAMYDNILNEKRSRSINQALYSPPRLSPEEAKAQGVDTMGRKLQSAETLRRGSYQPKGAHSVENKQHADGRRRGYSSLQPVPIRPSAGYKVTLSPVIANQIPPSRITDGFVPEMLAEGILLHHSKSEAKPLMTLRTASNKKVNPLKIHVKDRSGEREFTKAYFINIPAALVKANPYLLNQMLVPELHEHGILFRYVAPAPEPKVEPKIAWVTDE